MNKIIFLSVFSVLVALGCGKSGESSNANLKEVSMKVEGMTCTGCSEVIQTKVSKLTGVESVTANYKLGNALVKFDETKISKEDISKAISGLGYKTTIE